MNISQQQKKNEIPIDPALSSSNIPSSSSLSSLSAKPKRNVSISGSGLNNSPLKSAPSATTTEQSLFPTHIPVVEETAITQSRSPTHIPVVEETAVTKCDVKQNMDNNNNQNNIHDKSIDPDEDNISDESEYEYEDDDDAAFSGFLMANNGFGTSSSSSNTNTAASSTVPARIFDEDTGVLASSSRSSTSSTSTAILASAASSSVENEESETPAVPQSSRKKWREPSRAAVNMSLRAQQETSGSKRRLAQDLYRIMNQDTNEAGFSLAPQSEDSMEKWTIKLFQFDPDSNLAKDMMVLGIDNIELEMKFPEQYPFEPPFVRVVKPRFKRQTGFVMNGALCMELLTKDGWNPINDIESVVVSIRSLLVIGDGRLQASTEMTKAKYETLLSTSQQQKARAATNTDKDDADDDEVSEPELKKARIGDNIEPAASARNATKSQVGSYTATEAQAAYSHLSDYHKKKGWDTSGWWARKG